MTDKEDYYQVIFTDQIKKKQKKYRDGILKVLNGRFAELTNDEGKMIHKCANFKLDHDEDADLQSGFVGNYLVEIQKKLHKDDVVSGRCYNPGFVPMGEQRPNLKPNNPLAPPPSGLQKKPLHKVVAATHASASTAPYQAPPAKTIAPAPLAPVFNEYHPPSPPAPVFKQVPLMKKFINPLGADKIGDEKSIPAKAFALCNKDEDEKVRNTCFIDDFLMDQLMPHQVAGVQFLFNCITGMIL